MLKDELLKWAESLKSGNQPDYNEASNVNKEVSVRTKDELLKWVESLKGKGLPRYIDVIDANYDQVCIDGKWRNTLYSWSIVFAGGKWKYVETNDERGYVSVLKEFDDEITAVEFAKRHLNIYYLASLDDNSNEAVLRRYVQKTTNIQKRNHVL